MVFGLTSQCFTGDTLVSTEDGLHPIEEIRAGDYVWSENTETGEKELKKVLSVSITETDQLVHVTTGNGTEINTTENHPFYTEGKGWCVASELEEGDVLRTQDGKTETVASVETETLEKPVKVYNLEIEDSHTYYVSVDGVLVHNMCKNAPENSVVDNGGNSSDSITVTDDVIRNAMKDAPLKTQQKSVSIPVIQNYVNRVLSGETDIPMIKVDGNIIVDGNHRYITSRITGVVVEILDWCGGVPENVISWDDIILDPFDWGNR